MDGADLHRKRLKIEGREADLERTLVEEDSYQSAVFSILRNQLGMPQQAIDGSYTTWKAFTGGSEPFVRGIQAASGQVKAWAAVSGADVPDFFCGPWPDVSPNAASRSTDFGNVIYVHSGLVYGLRLLAQELTFTFPDLAKGDFESEKVKRASANIDAGMRLIVEGKDVRNLGTIRGFGHPELEQFRRAIIWGALSHAVAHEAGHLARNRPFRGGWSADNHMYSTTGLLTSSNEMPVPETEVEVMDSFAAELAADATAAVIARRDSFAARGYEQRRALVIGACLVPLLQAAVFWRRAADTDQDLGWTHPLPDLRVYLTQSVLSLPEEEFTRRYETPLAEGEAPPLPSPEKSTLEIETNGMVTWLQTLLGIPGLKERALADGGLEGRGMNPMSVVFLRMAYGGRLDLGSI